MPKMKVVFNKEELSHQEKVDAILDKISKSGYNSLSKGEKDFISKPSINQHVSPA